MDCTESIIWWNSFHLLPPGLPPGFLVEWWRSMPTLTPRPRKYWRSYPISPCWINNFSRSQLIQTRKHARLVECWNYLRVSGQMVADHLAWALKGWSQPKFFPNPAFILILSIVLGSIEMFSMVKSVRLNIACYPYSICPIWSWTHSYILPFFSSPSYSFFF